MKGIRKILVKLLGLKGYLKLVSRIYIACIRRGFLKGKYPEIHFLKQLIKPGSTVLDIGANLSYYSTMMTLAVGKEGKLFAVEPIPLFADIWKTNMNRLNGYTYHLEICALGKEPQDEVTMVIPVVNGVIRHGLTKVAEKGEVKDRELAFTVPMKNGDALVSDVEITQLDFLKCDVEGFEQYVIPSLDHTIKRDLPTIQIELSGEENRQVVAEYLVNLSYNIYVLTETKLVPVHLKDIFTFNQDFYFIHESRKNDYSKLIKQVTEL